MSKQNSEAQPKPVKISGEAHRVLANKMRVWSGWPDATLSFGLPSGGASGVAECNHLTHTFTVNADLLVRNPNRVLLTANTPFRLRQEAVLTGAMLHEASHARHSHWLPRDGSPALHTDGTEATPATIALARLMEEPRIETQMLRDGATLPEVGALAWTMRACAAAILPVTPAAVNAEQQLMDLLSSWALRAGRQIGRCSVERGHEPGWVTAFSLILQRAVVDHLVSQGEDADQSRHVAVQVLARLDDMILSEEDDSPEMLDLARDVLNRLFPGGAGSAPTVSVACGGASGEPGDGEGEGEGEGTGDEGEGEGESGEGEAEGTGKGEVSEDLAQALAAAERAANEAQEREESEEQASAGQGGAGAGAGSGGIGGTGWRQPTKAERDLQKGAERFLRGLIEPSETSKIVLSESPSATVDPAALAAWKAGGQRRDPMFFRRTKREVQPSPPAKIAILVDISGSMDELQEPSAVLSWALSSAALDLRNFAGHGTQVESTLIHWGGDATVIQKNGQTLPGIRKVNCWYSTTAMGDALRLVEEEMPGFFEPMTRPEHRLIVQFTDWELGMRCQNEVTPILAKAMANGVHMVTIAPGSYSARNSRLPAIMQQIRERTGRTSLMKYDSRRPTEVWDEAAKALA